MLNHIIDKYFNRILARFGNFNTLKMSIRTNFEGFRRSLRPDRLLGRDKNGYTIEVLDPDTKQVIQSVTVGKVEADGKIKPAWISLKLSARKPIDETNGDSVGG